MVDALVNSVEAFLSSDLPMRSGLRSLANHGGVLLHGSLTLGFADEFSDIDLWLLTSDDVTGHPHFLGFQHNGRPGHYTIESIARFAERVQRCDFPLIAELRYAMVLGRCTSEVHDLLTEARRPMRSEVRERWFCHHYIEMRSEHRACDSPICRGDSVALLIALTRTVTHALQAASVLDGEPYHYSKWLSRMARRGAVGKEVSALVDDVIKMISNNALRLKCHEADHPLTAKLKEIRSTLISSARENGIDAPWLTEWWLHMNEALGVEKVSW